MRYENDQWTLDFYVDASLYPRLSRFRWVAVSKNRPQLVERSTLYRTAVEAVNNAAYHFDGLLCKEAKHETALIESLNHELRMKTGASPLDLHRYTFQMPKEPAKNPLGILVGDK